MKVLHAIKHAGYLREREREREKKKKYLLDGGREGRGQSRPVYFQVSLSANIRPRNTIENIPGEFLSGRVVVVCTALINVVLCECWSV